MNNNRIEINEETPYRLIATYGTLRKTTTFGECGNYKGLLKDKSEFLGTIKSPAKYTLTGKGCGFPITVRNGNTAITLDIFKITNAEVLENVHRLEGCTGIPGHKNNWYDIELIETPFGEAAIYVMDGQGKSGIIESGDWSDR
jgi:hypothetical protein